MEAKDNNPKSMLNKAIEAVRSSEPDRSDMEDRAARVWARIGEKLSQEGPMVSLPWSRLPCRQR